MKDILRLDATTASSSVTTLLHAPQKIIPPAAPATRGAARLQDRVSVSETARTLGAQAAHAPKAASAERLEGLRAAVAANTLTIDAHGIAVAAVRDLSDS